MKKTWGKIKQEIIGLGFEEEEAYLENQMHFINSVNRAMVQIARTVRPILGKYSIVHYPLENLVPSGENNMNIVEYKGTPIIYTANAKAYTFEVSGNATITIVDGNGTNVINATDTGYFVRYKGFLNGNSTITFSGDYEYLIKNVAMYATTRSASVEDIPEYSNYTRYNLEDLTKENNVVRFMSFANDKPVQRGDYTDGKAYVTVDDYKKEEGKYILLNNFEKGQFDVWYNKYPLLIDKLTPDDYELELDFDVANLVPLLSAYFIWLDDDERKATAYYNNFDDMKNQVMASSAEPEKAEVLNGVNIGWW